MKHCTLIPIKDQKAMYVGGVKSGVCGFYTTLHTEYCYSYRRCIVLCIQWPLAPARREGYCVSLPSWGFSCSPLVSLRRQLC